MFALLSLFIVCSAQGVKFVELFFSSEASKPSKIDSCEAKIKEVNEKLGVKVTSHCIGGGVYSWTISVPDAVCLKTLKDNYAAASMTQNDGDRAIIQEIKLLFNREDI